MLNLKLKTIASLVKKDDIVIDIGCDHAYLAIYLKENSLCKEVYASDISADVLKIAKKNIKESKTNIKIYLSNGFESIEENEIDTAIISGMGTYTILNIINKAPSNITKYIISSNNEHYHLRKEMFKKGWYIKKEIVVRDKNKYYPIMIFTKEIEKESKLSLVYGKSDNKEYFNYLLTKEKNILSHIPKKHIINRLKHKKTIAELKTLAKKALT